MITNFLFDKIKVLSLVAIIRDIIFPNIRIIRVQRLKEQSSVFLDYPYNPYNPCSGKNNHPSSFSLSFSLSSSFPRRLSV